MLLNLPQSTGWPPTAKSYVAQNVQSAKVKKPEGKHKHSTPLILPLPSLLQFGPSIIFVYISIQHLHYYELFIVDPSDLQVLCFLFLQLWLFMKVIIASFLFLNVY